MAAEYFYFFPLRIIIRCVPISSVWSDATKSHQLLQYITITIGFIMRNVQTGGGLYVMHRRLRRHRNSMIIIIWSACQAFERIKSPLHIGIWYFIFYSNAMILNWFLEFFEYCSIRQVHLAQTIVFTIITENNCIIMHIIKIKYVFKRKVEKYLLKRDTRRTETWFPYLFTCMIG